MRLSANIGITSSAYRKYGFHPLLYCCRWGIWNVTFSQEILDSHQILGWWELSPYLGLWANAIAGEGILPLGQAQVGDEQAVIGSKGICEKMPV